MHKKKSLSKRYNTENTQLQNKDKQILNMSQNTHAIQEQKPLTTLQKIIGFASQQKLLPKILYRLDSECSKDKKKAKFYQYQAMIKQLYSQQCRVPLKYNPQQAFTHRQKFRQKILQLQNCQLDIEYFDKVKNKQGRYIPLFKGQPLQKIKYETKKQYKIFNNFNEKRFRNSYSNMFDDKLQLKQQTLFRKEIKKSEKRSITQSQQVSNYYLLPKPIPILNRLKTTQSQQSNNKIVFKSQNKKIKKIKLRPLTEPIQLQKIETNEPNQLKNNINDKFRPHIQKVYIGPMLSEISTQTLYKRMLNIGSYPQKEQQSTIALTKQSITKYLKLLYERQCRIVDFLQLKPKTSLQQYYNLCTKLKLMPTDHILFMCFMYYDFNNDGFICENDLRRVKEIYEKQNNKLLEEDYKILKNYKSQSITKAYQYDNKYLQLYKLPQVSQNTYFLWKMKMKEQEQKQQKRIEKEIEEERQMKIMMQQEEKLLLTQEQKLAKRKENGVHHFLSLKNKKNPFNPSVLKFKQNYNQQKAQVRKYLLSIKHKKIYISFEQFKSLFLGRKIQNNNNSNNHNNNRVRKSSLSSIRKNDQNDQKQFTKQLSPRTKVQRHLDNNKVSQSSNLNSHRSKHFHKTGAQVSNKKILKTPLKMMFQDHNFNKDAINLPPYKQSRTKPIHSINQSNNINASNPNTGSSIIYKPFLWYDLMDKLAGVRFQGLKYTNVVKKNNNRYNKKMFQQQQQETSDIRATNTSVANQ